MKPNILFIFVLISASVCYYLISGIANHPVVPRTVTQTYRPQLDLHTLETSVPPTSLLFLGDIMLGRSVNLGIIERNDVEWPLRGLYPETKIAHIALANLESPLLKDCPRSDSGFKFCGDAGNVQALVAANIKLVTIANNHISNYGQEGIKETISNLQSAGIAVVGTEHDPVVLKLHGVNYAFFGANDVGATPKQINTVDDSFLGKIRASQGRGEVVVVGIHWGNEYTSAPSPRQQELGKQLISAGATIVAGHHPHWVQPVTQSANTLLIYSLGNTVFDQEWSQETKKGMLVEIILQGKTIKSYRQVPISISNFGQADLE